MKGIDISVYQMGADWKKVKNSGIEFAMIKASQGGGIRDKGIAPFEDRGFAGSVAGASSVGIKCGAYHFMTGTTRDEVLEEAEFFIKTVKKQAAQSFSLALPIWRTSAIHASTENTTQTF